MENRPYIIDLPKLRLGTNTFSFELDGDFFTQVENSLIHTAQVTVATTIEKTPLLLDAQFAFQGQIGLVCDRCLQPYPQAVSATHRVVYGLDEEVAASNEQAADEVIFIGRNLQVLNLSQDFYDLVSLQVPLRKAPCDDKPEACLADPKVRELLDAAHVEEDIDPRWEALNQLKNQN